MFSSGKKQQQLQRMAQISEDIDHLDNLLEDSASILPDTVTALEITREALYIELGQLQEALMGKTALSAAASAGLVALK